MCKECHSCFLNITSLFTKKENKKVLKRKWYGLDSISDISYFLTDLGICVGPVVLRFPGAELYLIGNATLLIEINVKL